MIQHESRPITIRIAAILATLDEVESCLESTIYTFCNSDLEAYEWIRDVLLRSKQITISNHTVSLTPKGRETARELMRAVDGKG